MSKSRDIADSAATINYIEGLTSDAQTQINAKPDNLSDFGVTASASELNTLDGITAATTELNYVDGVTSAIQTQLDSKEPADATILKDADINSTVQGYVAPSTVGNVLTSDGTNWTSTAPSGGGSQFDFVATGTIPNGVAVVLNSDGTISTVNPDGYPPTAGTASVFEAANSYALSFCYDSTNNKIFAAYIDGATGYFTCVLGSVSGKTITFDTPVILRSDTGESGNPGSGCVYNPAANKVLVVYQWRDSSNNRYLRARAVDTVGSIILGSEATVANYLDVTMSHIRVSYDASASRVMIAYYWQYPYYTGYIEACSISGSNLSFGSNYAIGSQGTANYPKGLVYDSANQRTIIAYQRSTNIYLRAVNVSSNGSQSIGAEYNTSIPSSAISLAYESNQQKIIVAYTNSSNNSGNIVAIDYNGSSFSTGSVVTIPTVSAAFNLTIDFDSATNKIGIGYRDLDNGSPYPLKFLTATVSGSTVTVASSATELTASAGLPVVIYNSTENVFVVAYQDVGNNSYGTSVAIDSGQSNNIDYVGISDAAISNSSTGSITLRGGVSTNLSSLTPNSTYYVQTDGTITTTVSTAIAGKALSSTSLLLKGLL